MQQDGTGTQLKKLLRIVGITEKEGCKCGQRAAVMNSQGPDWCEQNIPIIVGWMKEEAQKRKLKLLFNEKIATLLIKKAISKARKKINQGIHLRIAEHQQKLKDSTNEYDREIEQTAIDHYQTELTKLEKNNE